MAEKQTVTLENKRILFKNFAGVKAKFNAEGARNFCVILTDDEADEMLKMGLNVKYLPAREEDDTPTPYLKIKVNWDGKPPSVVQITSGGRTRLDKNTSGILDWAELTNVDLMFSPWFWEVDEKSGYTCYLTALYATLYENELDLKYADVPESGAQSVVDTFADE